MDAFDRALFKSYRERGVIGGRRSFLLDLVLPLVVEKFPPLLFGGCSSFLCLGARDGFFVDALRGASLLPEGCCVVQADISYHLLAGAKFGYKVVVDDEALPFLRGSFDLILASFVLHGVNNLLGVLGDVHGVLRKGGMFLAVTLGCKTLLELKKAFVIAEMGEVVVSRIIPFVGVPELLLLAQRSGFLNLVVDVDLLQVSYPSIYALLHDIRDAGGGNFLKFRGSKPLTRGMLNRVWDLYKSRIAGDENGAPVEFEIVTLKGEK